MYFRLSEIHLSIHFQPPTPRVSNRQPLIHHFLTFIKDTACNGNTFVPTGALIENIIAAKNLKLFLKIICLI